VAKQPAKVRLAGDTLFDYKKSELKPEGRVALDNLLTNIKDVKIAKIIAVGHTDGIANDKYNNALSLARVESVKAYLVSKGVDANLIETSGKGKTQPVADNATDEGRAKNRRVDITVVPQGAAAK
jgi:outer membrane protein OmpA-like peptidoglycan-associated protein